MLAKKMDGQKRQQGYGVFIRWFRKWMDKKRQQGHTVFIRWLRKWMNKIDSKDIQC